MSEAAGIGQAAAGTVKDVVVEAIRCVKCGHSLMGLKLEDQCPGCKTAVRESVATPSIEDAFCIQCGYQLRGLQREGMCPECGTAVERSLRGSLLRYSALEYVRSLRRGAWLILAAIVIQLLLGLGGLAVLAVSSAMGGAAGWMPTVHLGMQGLGMVVGFMSLYGWWQFSELDPGYTGREQGTTARKVVRWALAVGAAEAVASFVMQAIPSVQTSMSGVAIGILIMVVAMAVSGVQFFASMLYVRWLAPRLPNQKVYKRTKLLIWLGPVLMTVGALCVGIGPLVALVMYWNMIYWMYKDLVGIERTIGLDTEMGIG